MRKVMYECYVGDVLVKAVDGYEAAEAWQKEFPQGRIKIALAPFVVEEEEKAREERLRRIALRNAVRDAKRKEFRPCF